MTDMIVETLLHSNDTQDQTRLFPFTKHQWQSGGLPDRLTEFGIPQSRNISPVYNGDNGESLLVFSQSGTRVVLIPLPEPLRFEKVQKAFKTLSHKRRSYFQGTAVLDLRHFADADIGLLSDAAISGLMLGSYETGLYKDPEKRPPHPLRGPEAQVGILTNESAVPAATDGSQIGTATASTQLRIMELVNAPSNKKTPADLAQWAAASARQFGYQAAAIGRDELEEMGMHALLGVNRGSEHPACLIVTEYRPAQPINSQPVALVGKGVTFDTGGLSIKPSTNMHYMKSDMGGAAAVLGTMELAARLSLPVHLVGVVPATDNSVDALSIKPGDVLDSYSGKTIEVIDTDAEGRLILADALSWTVRKYNPEYLIDLATLTGSAIRTFGYACAAMMSNSDELADSLFHSGMTTGERVWRLPLWEDYAEEMVSDIADVRNLSARPAAGAITAGKFLEHFIEGHTNWAHMDIAGVAFGESGLSRDKSSTGFGPRLLTNWLTQHFSAKKGG